MPLSRSFLREESDGDDDDVDETLLGVVARENICRVKESCCCASSKRFFYAKRYAPKKKEEKKVKKKKKKKFSLFISVCVSFPLDVVRNRSRVSFIRFFVRIFFPKTLCLGF